METDEGARILVHLCFSGFSENPADITSVLNISPTAVHRAGDTRASTAIARKNSFWATELADAQSIDVGKILEEAVEKLIGKEEQISSLSQMSTDQAYIGMAVSYKSEKPFINIRQETLKALGAMTLALDIELFPNE